MAVKKKDVDNKEFYIVDKRILPKSIQNVIKVNDLTALWRRPAGVRADPGTLRGTARRRTPLPAGRAGRRGRRGRAVGVAVTPAARLRRVHPRLPGPPWLTGVFLHGSPPLTGR